MLAQQRRAHHVGRAVGQLDRVADGEVLAARRVIDLDHRAGPRRDGSSAISFMDRIGPQGMSCLLRISIASNLVLVMVHSSIWRRSPSAAAAGPSGWRSPDR